MKGDVIAARVVISVTFGAISFEHCGEFGLRSQKVQHLLFHVAFFLFASMGREKGTVGGEKKGGKGVYGQKGVFRRHWSHSRSRRILFPVCLLSIEGDIAPCC